VNRRQAGMPLLWRQIGLTHLIHAIPATARPPATWAIGSSITRSGL
jgi:hypothetical protein